MLKKTALTQTTEEYASRSSIHGVAFVFDRELNLFDRLLWLFVVIGLLGGAAMFTWNFWSQWRDEQVGESTHSYCRQNYVCELPGCDDPEGHEQTCK